jgi:hypothetical protein
MLDFAEESRGHDQAITSGLGPSLK